MIEELREYVIGRARLLRDTAARATPGPLLVRCAVWLATAVAGVLAFPAKLVPTVPGLLGIVLLGLIPTVAPRTRLVSAVILFCVFGWLTSSVAFEQSITAPRLVGLGAALYLLHSLAALAAVLPYDAVVSPGVLGGWLLRAAGVVAAGAVFGVAALAATGLLGGRTYLLAAVAGLGGVGVLAWLLARRA